MSSRRYGALGMELAEESGPSCSSGTTATRSRARLALDAPARAPRSTRRRGVVDDAADERGCGPSRARSRAAARGALTVSSTSIAIGAGDPSRRGRGGAARARRRRRSRPRRSRAACPAARSSARSSRSPCDRWPCSRASATATRATASWWAKLAALNVTGSMLGAPRRTQPGARQGVQRRRAVQQPLPSGTSPARPSARSRARAAAAGSGRTPARRRSAPAGADRRRASRGSDRRWIVIVMCSLLSRVEDPGDGTAAGARDADGGARRVGSVRITSGWIANSRERVRLRRPVGSA